MIPEMDTESRYSLADLARVTGVTPRTVRYYIAQGLLPGANETGPGASYDGRHLARLQLVRKLQRQHLPLAEIRSRLGSLSDAEVAGLSAAPSTVEDDPAGSALDYIRGVLGAGLRKRRPGEDELISYPPTPKATSAPPAAAQLLMHATTSRTEPDFAAADLPADDLAEASPALMRRARSAPPTAPTTPPATEATTPSRSQWDRIALTDDIELHVRRPLSRLDSKRVDRLITIARQVLGEEKP
jgi:DNA-binding transcriptional MerR regulator